MIRSIDGGITTPRGFRAAGVSCGIKKRRNDGPAPLDLALIVTETPVPAAAVFTTNKAVAAPVVLSRQHLEHTGGWARAIVDQQRLRQRGHRRRRHVGGHGHGRIDGRGGGMQRHGSTGGVDGCDRRDSSTSARSTLESPQR